MSSGNKKIKKKHVKNSLKARAHFKHTARRIQERFGVFMGPVLYSQLIKEIQTGVAQFIEKRSNRLSLFRTMYENQSLVLVYDKLRKTIVTVLHDTEQKEIDAAASN
ncbi:MAG: hypothetical protein D4S01_07380 [Dehalococcoidia bacterium]|nr:MAG: hypothetical protein D4S01_07380 [Dehalococcoidia bacterium]